MQHVHSILNALKRNENREYKFCSNKRYNELFNICNKLYGIAMKHDSEKKSLNKLYLIVICIADAVVDAIVIITSTSLIFIYFLSGSNV